MPTPDELYDEATSLRDKGGQARRRRQARGSRGDRPQVSASATACSPNSTPTSPNPKKRSNTPKWSSSSNPTTPSAIPPSPSSISAAAEIPEAETRQSPSPFQKEHGYD